MKELYHLEYEETEQIFVDMYEVYNNNRSAYLTKLFTIMGGLLVFVINISVDPARFSILYLVKFLALWAFVFVAVYYIDKHIIRKSNAKGAKDIGKQNYKTRVEKCGKDLKVDIRFYQDNFTVSCQDETQEYSYKEVSSLFENGKIYGMVTGGVYGKKAMVSFPASCLDAVDKEAFGSYMEEKCQNVAGGFRKV